MTVNNIKSSNWLSVPLEQLITEVQSGFASGERAIKGCIQVRMNNVTTEGNLDWTNITRVPSTQSQINKYSLRLGDVLFNSTNSPELVGKTAVFHGYPEPVVFSNHFICIRVDTTRLDPCYLARWINNLWKQRVFQKLCTSWVNQAAVRREDLLALNISLPPLSEQKRIAAVLEKADRLRSMRRYALELSDTYLQTVFLEMFGDPVTNPNSLEFKTLGDVIHSTQDGPHVSPDYTENGIPFLSTRNIRPGQMIWDDLKFIPRKDAEKYWEKCKPERGDILYTKGGTTGLAKVIDFDTEVAIWVHIALLKLRHNIVDSLWLENMLNSDFCYNQSQELTHGIANHDLGLSRMIKIKLYLPPLAQQKQFAQIAKKYKRIQAQQREAARQVEHLFQTLLHEAFEGELSAEMEGRVDVMLGMGV